MAEPVLVGNMVCTEPLPNDFSPIMMARLESCNAPATISDAEAEPALINTTIGAPSIRSSGAALKRICELAMRPSV